MASKSEAIVGNAVARIVWSIYSGIRERLNALVKS